MTAGKPIELISVEDYLTGELTSQVRHEYSGGYVYAMAGAKNVHNTIATNWLGATHARLRGKPCQAFNSNVKGRVKFPSHTRFYYPEGMIVCDPNDPEDSYQDRPVAIAEVVSDSTRRIDENEKRDAYQSIPSLDVYLVIETDAPQVVVHRRTAAGFVSELYEGLESTIPLAAVEGELPLAELYERVTFTSGPGGQAS